MKILQLKFCYDFLIYIDIQSNILSIFQEQL
jgi:hypothetical protein